jgi:hypothetical protein
MKNHRFFRDPNPAAVKLTISFPVNEESRHRLSFFIPILCALSGGQ